VSNSAAFLFGALGGVTSQTLLALAALRDLRSGDARFAPTPLRVLAALAFTAANAAASGVVTLFLLSGSENVAPAAAVMIGLGWSAFLPTITRLVPRAGEIERSSDPARGKAARPGPERRQAGSQTDGWFTTERVQVLLSFGGFVLAFLTFVFK
jgi:hypothetical protein